MPMTWWTTWKPWRKQVKLSSISKQIEALQAFVSRKKMCLFILSTWRFGKSGITNPAYLNSHVYRPFISIVMLLVLLLTKKNMTSRTWNLVRYKIKQGEGGSNCGQLWAIWKSGYQLDPTLVIICCGAVHRKTNYSCYCISKILSIC